MGATFKISLATNRALRLSYYDRHAVTQLFQKADGWARDRQFLTATSGMPHKFDLNGRVVVPKRSDGAIHTRDGKHVHIGFLSAEQTLRVNEHLDKLSCRERFIHIEHVSHLASTLSELAPSVYIDSYPIGGGKAIVEAMAAGLPICAATHDPSLDSSSFCYPECFRWTHPAELRKIFVTLDPPTVGEAPLFPGSASSETTHQ